MFTDENDEEGEETKDELEDSQLQQLDEEQNGKTSIFLLNPPPIRIDLLLAFSISTLIQPW